MFKVDEFSRSCGELGLAFRVLDPNASRALVRDVFGKFKPVKTSGHVALGDDAVSIPLEPHDLFRADSPGVPGNSGSGSR